MAIETIDYSKCTDCGICYDVCPMDCFGVMETHRANKMPLVYIKHEEDCETCYLCELYCPEDCLYVSPYRAEDPVLPY